MKDLNDHFNINYNEELIFEHEKLKRVKNLLSNSKILSKSKSCNYFLLGSLAESSLIQNSLSQKYNPKSIKARKRMSLVPQSIPIGKKKLLKKFSTRFESFSKVNEDTIKPKLNFYQSFMKKYEDKNSFFKTIHNYQKKSKIKKSKIEIQKNLRAKQRFLNLKKKLSQMKEMEIWEN